MKLLQRLVWVVLVFHFLSGVFPEVSAAPGDVFGSPNVAIDTYRNSKGTYVLWSDGRITSAEGGAQDLGKPYRNPDAAARIGDPSHEQGRSLGSPHVAVKAIPRPDASYVLFADGRLRRPANDDAAASGGGGNQVVHIFGTIGPGFTLQGQDTEAYRFVGGNVQLSEPVSAQASGMASIHVTGMGPMGQDSTTVTVSCAIEQGGTRVRVFPGANETINAAILSGSTVHMIVVDK